MTKKVLIIGAGPAGISAAIELAQLGIHSTVIDESPKVGGVIYRGPWRNTPDMPHLDERLTNAINKLQEQYQQHTSHIDFKPKTTALGPTGDCGILISQDNKLSKIEYTHLLMATGCQERSVPFPGWQLPGVMLLGAIQLQVKSGLVRPGNKVVITGSGPLLPLVACQLHRAGCKVEGIYEAARLSSFAKETLAMLNRPKQALGGISLLGYLKLHNIPLHYGWGLVKAEGEHQLSKVTVAPYDEDWKPDHSRAISHMVDTLGVGYGFASRSQLAQLIGVDMEYDHTNGPIPKVDRLQRSSQQNIYCAGDSVKVTGVDTAMLEGRIAASSIAYELGQLDLTDAEKRISALRRPLKRLYRFHKALETISSRKPGLLTLAQDDTIVCRCEQVERRAIDHAIEQGCRDVVTLKMRTRVTMGDCQGMTCSHYCYDRLRSEIPNQEQTLARPRFPLNPIPFSALEED